MGGWCLVLVFCNDGLIDAWVVLVLMFNNDGLMDGSLRLEVPWRCIYVSVEASMEDVFVVV